MNSHFNNDIIKGAKTAAVLLCTLVALLVIYNPYNKANVSIFLSVVIIAISLIPFLLWQRRKDRDVVILGVVFYGFFYMIGFGFPGLITHELAIYYDHERISDASEHIAQMLVISHLLIVFGGLYFLQFLFKNSESTNKSHPEASITKYRFIIALCFFLTVFEILRVLNIPLFSTTGIVIYIVRFFAYMYLFYFLFYLNFGGWFIKILAIIGCLISQGAFDVSLSINPYLEVGMILVLISIQKGRLPIAAIALLMLGFVLYQPMKGTVRTLSDQEGVGIAESITLGMSSVEGSEYLDLIDVATKRVNYTLLPATFVENIGAKLVV